MTKWLSSIISLFFFVMAVSLAAADLGSNKQPFDFQGEIINPIDALIQKSWPNELSSEAGLPDVFAKALKNIFNRGYFAPIDAEAIIALEKALSQTQVLPEKY